MTIIGRIVEQDGIDGLSGRSVSGARDVNGDGLANLIVGADHADPGGNHIAGESYAVFGNPSCQLGALSRPLPAGLRHRHRWRLHGRHPGLPRSPVELGVIAASPLASGKP
jgi:hypothetical protein